MYSLSPLVSNSGELDITLLVPQVPSLLGVRFIAGQVSMITLTFSTERVRYMYTLYQIIFLIPTKNRNQ